MAGSALVELTGIRKSYGGMPEVLGGVDLRIGAGETLAVTGPSGCGKSTLLNIVGALDRPDSGSVRFEGAEMLELDEKRLSAIRNRRIGFVFQFHHLLPQCTVLENVLVPTIVHGHGRQAAADRARKLLEKVGLSGKLSSRPGQLSGGERQRAAVVRALVNSPALLLADEPTGSLDRAGSENLADLLGDLNRDEGVAMMVVTHSPHLARRMGKVLELRDGQLAPAAA